MSAELLAESLKKLINNKSFSIISSRAFGYHPCSIKAYVKSHLGSLMESGIERAYNIEMGNKNDSIPLDINEAWVYLSENPKIAEKYIRKKTNEYFYFSQEIIIELASELVSELVSDSESESELESESKLNG